MQQDGLKLSLAIDEEGNLWSWGQNDHGQVGDGTTADRATPVQITEGTIFKKVAASMDHSLAIDIEGNLWGWGYNAFGQLGDGTTTDRTRPTRIRQGIKFSEIAGGNYANLAIDEEGNLWACGLNSKGQLGDGTTTNRKTPIQIKAGTAFKKITLGTDLCGYAIDIEGNLWGWGYNRSGQLGDGTTTQRNSPIQIKAGTIFEKTAGCVGGDSNVGHSIAIDEEGNLWAWGKNTSGQLGDGTTTNRTTPVQIKAGTIFKEVAAGRFHNLAIDKEGNLWVWGQNSSGELGDGTTTQRLTPVQIF